MPIGDLLAQISGGKSSSASPSTPNLPRPNALPFKRKADSDLRDASKATRRDPLPQASSLPSRSSNDRPAQSPHPAVSNGARPSPATSTRPAPPLPKLSRPSVAARSQPAAATPSPVSRAPPKKGSFAEILARGQRAQAVMGQVGKIQHKKVEKGAVKTKDDVKPAAPVKGKGAAAYKGSSRTTSHGGNNGHATRKEAREPDTQRTNASASKRAAIEQEMAEKKMKKAAQATTGYTGTARPKPGNPAKKKDAPRGGALLNAPVPRHGSTKRSRYEDDFDEELDDFIEYDDEEDGDMGPRYDYASDGSSDMEAGLDDIDVEEQRAEMLARKEDIEEERLEKTLKAAKEDRKRKALEALRASKQH
ncbi:hypothetical protein HIM_07622 [Hirsutella minnesotensis 3608]|uniref:SPT2 chromatin protein n=1 Tax=Hirsutella minnesotensis 3608 TaxID=1043627 RepID=A0A0F7ZN33_9HYPO|nr:hypothetical protein HIM_07622 [Hirsutella minnesotensis 3608]